MVDKDSDKSHGGSENLVPLPALDAEKALEARQAGGRAAAKARKNNRILRDAAKMLIGSKVTSKNVIARLKAMGIEDEELTYADAMTIAMINQVIRKGDAKAYIALRDTIGEMPVKQLEISDNRDDISLYDRLLQASQAALDVKQQAYIQIPITSPEVVDVEQAPDDS